MRINALLRIGDAFYGDSMQVYLSLLVAILGALGYSLSNNPKVAELSRIAYFAGLLAFLLVVSGNIVKILR